MAIYVRSSLAAQVLLAKSISKQFEILALSIAFSGGQNLTIVGCYRPPSATAETSS